MITNRSDEISQNAVKVWATEGIDEEDEETAINRGLDELEAGKDRPFAEFAEELSARFAAHYEQ